MLTETHYADIAAAAVRDPSLTGLARTELQRQLLLAAGRSPEGLRAVARALAGNANVDVILAELAAESLPRWRNPAAVDEFVDWFWDLTDREELRQQILKLSDRISDAKSGQGMSAPQEQARERLHLLADIFEDYADSSGGVRPRTLPLIVGPSGAGKSWLVERFARERDAGFLRLTYGNWIVRGARGGVPTLERVARLIANRRFTVISVDELDKLSAGLGSDWSVALRDELYSLLDRSALDGWKVEGVAGDPAEALRKRVFVVGCGTWQHVWEGAERAVGFQAVEHRSHSTRIGNSPGIGEELRRRFDSRLLLLPPLSAEELRTMAETSGLSQMAKHLQIVLDFEDGAQSGLGMRWLENQHADLELRRRGVRPAALGLSVLSVGTTQSHDIHE